MKFSQLPRASIRSGVALLGVVIVVVAGCSSGGAPDGETPVAAQQTKKFAAMLRQGKSPQELRQALDREAKGLPEPPVLKKAATKTLKKKP